MAAKITVERVRSRRPSTSTRSISTADERPVFSPVTTHSESPTTVTRSISSVDDEWDADVDNRSDRGARRSRRGKQRLYVDTHQEEEPRGVSRASRHRVPVPEAPPRRASRSSRRDYREGSDEKERFTYPQETMPYRPRVPSTHSDGLYSYNDDPRRERDYFTPRYAQPAPQPWGRTGGYDSGYSPMVGPMQPPAPPASQIIPFQQQFQPQPFYQSNPLASPYMHNPLSPALSHSQSYMDPPRMAPQPQYLYIPYPVQTPGVSAPPSAPQRSTTPRSEIEENRFEEKLQQIQEMMMTQEKARFMREQQREMREQQEKQMAINRAQKELDERNAKDALEAAIKIGKAEAEAAAEEKAKKIKAENEKALAEAKTAAEAAKAEAAKHKPADDAGKAPIKFKDAVGRKFSFPWRLCKTWKGMEELINQAFLHVDVIGKHVQAGHYDLTGPNGEIILPTVWESTIQPDWQIEMQLWPIEEKKERKPEVQQQRSSRRETVEYDRYGGKKTRRRAKSVSSGISGVVVVPAAPSSNHRASSRHRQHAAPPPPPAPAPPSAVYEGVMAPPPPPPVVSNSSPIERDHAPVVTVVKERRRSTIQAPGGLTGWMAESLGYKVRGKKK